MARPDHNTDLHGSAPETSDTALILVDVLNDFLFAGGAKLAAEASAILPALVSLKQDAIRHRIPVIYVNDNAGRWRSDHQRVLKKAGAKGSRGRAILRRLAPRATDYIVLKPKQSAFYGTPLEVLLDYLKVRRLVIAGFAADICVFFTAQDAFVRDYSVCVPSDCIASETPEKKGRAVEEMIRLFAARIVTVRKVKWN